MVVGAWHQLLCRAMIGFDVRGYDMTWHEMLRNGMKCHDMNAMAGFRMSICGVWRDRCLDLVGMFHWKPCTLIGNGEAWARAHAVQHHFLG